MLLVTEHIVHNNPKANWKNPIGFCQGDLANSVANLWFGLQNSVIPAALYSSDLEMLRIDVSQYLTAIGCCLTVLWHLHEVEYFSTTVCCESHNPPHERVTRDEFKMPAQIHLLLQLENHNTEFWKIHHFNIQVACFTFTFIRRFYPKQLTVRVYSCTECIFRHWVYIQAIHLYCQYMCSLGIEPTTFALLKQCSNHWATGTH